MPENGSGTAQYRRDQKRRSATFVASLVIAGVATLVLSYAVREAHLSGRPLPGFLAIGIALFFVGAWIAANWLYLRNSDELVWEDNLRASFWAFLVHVALYPTWLVLWAGRLAPAPSAKGLWITTLAAGAVVYIARRLRSR